MGTISSAGSVAFTSPKQRILDSISSQVGTGSISSTDQAALDGAVDSIDSTLQSNRSASSAKLSSSDLKGRVDDLISQQVSNGTLTSDQAETLKQVFAQGPGSQTGSSSENAGVHGVGGHRHAGPPPGPPPSDDTGTASDSSTDTTGSTTGSASDLLASFIKQLQASQSQSSGYGSSGTLRNSSQFTNSLLLNFEA